MAYRERCTTAGGRVRHSVPWSTAAGGGRRPTVTTTRTGTPTTALSCPSEWRREDRCSSPITRFSASTPAENETATPTTSRTTAASRASTERTASPTRAGTAGGGHRAHLEAVHGQSGDRCRAG